MTARATWEAAVRDFPAGDPFVSLVAPKIRALGLGTDSPGADALGVTPPTPVSFDALTDLFLGGAPRPADGPAPGAVAPRHTNGTHHAQPHAAPLRAPGVELLIAGHLPVMASAWVQQYARDRATALAAPVALVDLRTGRAWVQLLDPAASFVAEPGATLAAAVTRVRAVARAWMIRVDEGDESALRAGLPGAALTLLSGADQAATVGAYRTLKRLAATGRPDRVHVAVMGADADQAAHAIDRLATAAKTFLNIALDGAAIAARVDASIRAVTAFAGPLPAGGTTAGIKLLADTLAAATRVDAAGPQHDEDDDEDDVVTTAPPMPAPSAVSPTGAASAAAAPAPVAKTSPADPLDQPRAAAPVAPVMPVMPAGPAPSSGPTAAPIDGLAPGLEPLPARCPAAPTVRLGCDAQGRLHLVAIDLAPADAPVGPSVEHLLIAGAWASENAELLRLAFPRLRHSPGPSSPPVLHLAVDQPRRVRHLLDTPVRLHVLAAAADTHGWVARALN
jgi:hypothetical protein